MRKSLSCALCVSALAVLLGRTVAAEIQFVDASAGAGISHIGPSFGASWGDFNGDGWPDLWVSNHYESPSIYLNQTDGSFSDVALQVWPGPTR